VTREGERPTPNKVVRRQVLDHEKVKLINQILQRVVTSGTGRQAALPDRPVAGKTGTTENYGDAWFVGYTPQLAVAVWVGYPNELRPMETEFHGKPVAGGTLPAQIWKAFMTRALAKTGPKSFNPAPYLPAYDVGVVFRDGRWRLDNGYCPNTRVISYFAGNAPATTARCYANEVSVPTVVGRSVESARVELQSVPLTPDVVYVPAKPRSRPGQVVRQLPAGGRYLSAHGSVRLWVSAAQDGLVPNLVGSSLPDARQRSRKLGLRLRVRYDDGPSGTVLEQSLEPGLAARRGQPITLVVGRDSTS
jgi:membrane peptidoglycan carboxypeptidase